MAAEAKAAEGGAVAEAAAASAAATGEAGEGGGHRRVSVHPLAIVSICDHYTRVSVGGVPEEQKFQRASEAVVVGLLFGTQDGLNVSILDAAEAPFALSEDADKVVVFDKAAVAKKVELCEAVHPLQELLGWYTVSAHSPNASDLVPHRQITEHFNHNPLLFVMNPAAAMRAERGGGSSAGRPDEHLPVSVFESELHMVDSVPTTIFVAVDFQLGTLASEQIAVEHIAQAQGPGGGAAGTEAPSSAVDSQTTALNSSATTLVSQLNILLSYLAAVKDGTVAPDHALLRDVNKICRRLPPINADTFENSMQSETNEAMLVAYLAAVTKTTEAVSSLADRYGAAYGERFARGGGGGGRGDGSGRKGRAPGPVSLGGLGASGGP